MRAAPVGTMPHLKPKWAPQGPSGSHCLRSSDSFVGSLFFTSTAPFTLIPPPGRQRRCGAAQEAFGSTQDSEGPSPVSLPVPVSPACLLLQSIPTFTNKAMTHHPLPWAPREAGPVWKPHPGSPSPGTPAMNLFYFSSYLQF